MFNNEEQTLALAGISKAFRLKVPAEWRVSFDAHLSKSYPTGEQRQAQHSGGTQGL